LFEFELVGAFAAAAAPEAPADLGRCLALSEVSCPGGEEAVTAEAIELGQDRDDGVVGGLDGKIVEIAAGRMAERRDAPPDLEPSLVQQQRVETTDRRVTARTAGVERVDPIPRRPIQAQGTSALHVDARRDDHADRRR
jgi:hypothetical protein